MPDDFLALAAIYVLFALVPAAIAPSRKRSSLEWFGVALLLSPLIALVLIVLLPPKSATQI